MYEEDLQKYLKITGLQASDLAKPRTKKKDVSKNSAKAKAAAAAAATAAAAAAAASAAAAVAQPTPQPTAAHSGNNQSAMHAMFRPQLAAQMAAAAQMAGFPGSTGQQAAGSDLPHFSQVWATGSGPAAASQAPPGYSAPGYGQSNTTAASQQMAGGDTAAAAAWLWPQLLQQQQQQYGAASFDAVQQAMQQALQQQQHATLQQQQVLQQQALLARSQNGVADGQNKKAETTAAADNTNADQSGTGDVTQQRNNGMILCANLCVSQTCAIPTTITTITTITTSTTSTCFTSTVNCSNISLSKLHYSPSLFPSSTPCSVVHVSTSKSFSFGLPASDFPCGVPSPRLSSAHTQFNSYANSPCQELPAAESTQAELISLFNKDGFVQSELTHLRKALSEKTEQVQLLTQKLEQAYMKITEMHVKS